MSEKESKIKKGLSRREFLKTAGALAAGVAGSGQLIKAAAAVPSRLSVPNIIRADSKTVVLAIQSFAHDAIKAVLPDFQSKTGLTVQLEEGPASGIDMLTKYSTAFAAGNSPVDVLSDADESSPAFMRAGWLEPLDDVIPQETWDDFPESFKSQIEIWHSFEGKRYRVPHEFAIGYFFTRKDLLDSMKLTAPTTWQELVDTGKKVTDAAKGVWATTDGLAKPGLLYVFVAYLAAQTGGEVFKLDDATGQAIQFLYDMIYTHKIFPETALNDDYNAQNELYMKDKIMFMRQWPFFQSVAEGNTDWFKPEKMVITLPPAGSAGAKAWWGGWGFDVPKAAPNLDGAKELIKYLTSPQVIPLLAQGQSWFIVPRASILKAFEGKNNPIVTAMGEYAKAGVPSPRPFHPKVSEAQTIVENIASLFLTKQSSLADALKSGQEQIAALG
jgi:ABC-type glycerol-3-phosphate transport system substrate-binding protein